MLIRLDHLNKTMQAKSFAQLNDAGKQCAYYRGMAEPKHDWYLKEWLAYYGKKQADVVRDLDWNKARVSLTVSGKQPYTREDINEVSAYLNLSPFELLMHPDDAMNMRRLLNDMIRLAREQKPLENEAPLKKVSLN